MGEKRSATRRDIHWRALVVNLDGSVLGPCVVRNVSETGAKIVHREKIDGPDEFFLLLAAEGKVKRHCRVAWRSEKEMGVRFIVPAE